MQLSDNSKLLADLTAGGRPLFKWLRDLLHELGKLELNRNAENHARAKALTAQLKAYIAIRNGVERRPPTEYSPDDDHDLFLLWKSLGNEKDRLEVLDALAALREESPYLKAFIPLLHSIAEHSSTIALRKTISLRKLKTWTLGLLPLDHPASPGVLATGLQYVLYLLERDPDSKPEFVQHLIRVVDALAQEPRQLTALYSFALRQKFPLGLRSRATSAIVSLCTEQPAMVLKVLQALAALDKEDLDPFAGEIGEALLGSTEKVREVAMELLGRLNPELQTQERLVLGILGCFASRTESFARTHKALVRFLDRATDELLASVGHAVVLFLQSDDPELRVEAYNVLHKRPQCITDTAQVHLMEMVPTSVGHDRYQILRLLVDSEAPAGDAYIRVLGNFVHLPYTHFGVLVGKGDPSAQNRRLAIDGILSAYGREHPLAKAALRKARVDNDDTIRAAAVG